ncbi:TPA: hypothetical protein JBJ74_15190, partial [Legionella pneumophila]|nr:hypothetical protein [Legionella pneumophila]
MPKNKNLYKILQNNHSELASLYDSSYKILQNKKIRNRVHASAYCLREMLINLPKELDSSLIKPIKKGSIELQHVLDKWENLNINSFLDISSEDNIWESEQIGVVKNFLMAFNRYVEEVQNIKKTRKEYTDQFIHSQNKKYSLEHLPDNHINFLGKTFYNFLDYFNKILHNPFSNTNEEEFKQHLIRLENYLIGLIEPNIKETYKNIDKIIKAEDSAPSIESVKMVFEIIHNKVSYDYFFKKLNSPNWLKVLEKEGVFNNPYGVIPYDEWVQIPIWGPSRYLVKVAKAVPKETLSIIQSIPDTNNLKIYEDFIDAALEMPIEYSIKIINKALCFLDSPYSFNYPSKLCSFAVFLLKANQVKRAFSICYRIFDIQKSSENYVPYKHYFTNNWEYNENLTAIYNNLKTPETKLSLFRLICIQLKNCMHYDGLNETSFVDRSSSWRQEVNVTAETDNDIKNILTDWLVKLSQDLVIICQEKVFSSLIHEPYPIFTRIVLYLLQDRLHLRDYILELLQKEEYCKSTDVWHEYATLFQKVFPVLEGQKQELLLNFISNINVHKKEESNEAIKFRLYYLLKKYLKGSIKDDFRVMLQKYGDIENPTFMSYIYSQTICIEDLIPISLEEFNEKKLDERLQYISEWEPSNSYYPYNSKSVLFNLLQNSIKSLSNEYLIHINKLKVNEEQFIVSVLRGFESVLINNASLNWDPLINYLNWAVKRRNDTKLKLTEIRISACRLLEIVFSTNRNESPFHLRDQIWLIIYECLKDPDPSADAEDKENGDSDFYHAAINSVRSRALECSIRYGLWCMRNLKIPNGEGKEKKYPELFQALNHHLNFEKEKSIAVHTIYGRWLPWLYLLDKNWTNDNLSKIFPMTNDKLKFRKYAWETYLLYVEPYDEMYILIEKEYIYAVNQLQKDTSDKPSIRLIDELVHFYLRGTIESLESEVFNVLYKKNNVDLFKEIVTITGRIVPKIYKDKAISIWEKTLLKCDELDEYRPLTEFGDWASLEFIDDNWLLDQIIIVLNKAKNIYPAHTVTDRLYQLTKTYPRKVAEILNLVV